MTIQQWDYVLAVIEYGNFTRAAEACFVTQPTLSIQISKLEDELGMKLLNRISSPVSVAPGAEEIIRRSRSALRLIQSIPGIAEDLKGDLSGTLSVGVIPTLSQYLLPLFLSQFLADYPGLHLKISEKPSSDIVGDIKDFRLDCGILALPVGKEGLVEERLFDEEFMVYMPPGRKREESVSLARLDLNDILLLTEGHCLRDQILDICGSPEKRQDLRLEFETGSLESLKKLVDQGLGFTLLPELSTAGLDEEQKARVIPLSPVPPMRQIGLVFHPACSRPGLVRKLAAALVKELPEKVRQNKTGFPVPWKKL